MDITDSFNYPQAVELGLALEQDEIEELAGVVNDLKTGDPDTLVVRAFVAGRMFQTAQEDPTIWVPFHPLDLQDYIHGLQTKARGE